MSKYRSWGQIPNKTQKAITPNWSNFQLPDSTTNYLAFGNGRSYGDSCFNSNGLLIDGRSLNRFIEFDKENGIITCEPGVLLLDILDITVKNGWFLPATPGTKFVTVGGAIANDVHGKNHHVDGTFGRHIISLELLRSDGNTVDCSKTSNTALFNATIGGLGLTGFILRAQIQLLKIDSAYMEVNTQPFSNLEEFSALSKIHSSTHQYSVAWLDCSSTGTKFGRGIFIAGNHCKGKTVFKEVEPKDKKLKIPFNFPSKVLNQHTIRAFNETYYQKNKKLNSGFSIQHYDKFFYPLDGIENWNRIYGRKGFYQYQFVIPSDYLSEMKKILKIIVDSGLGSFLAVLKEFGNIASPGLLSFPRPGYCLALDFSNRGRKTLEVLNHLDDLVIACGGAVYPAKDARMSKAAFEAYYPKLNEFKKLVDPNFSSDFWRRVAHEN